MTAVAPTDSWALHRVDAALGLAIDMLGAILLVHAKAGFVLPTGMEFVLLLLGAAVTIALAGPGAYSIDHAVARRGRLAPAAAVRA